MIFSIQQLKKLKRSSGFTLLELIVVITIIGILGTIVTMRVAGWVGKTKAMKVKQDLQTVVRAAEMYYYDTGSYPESVEELRGGTSPDGEKLSFEFERGLLDPWGNEYNYEFRDGKPHAWCLGKDGVEGGGEDNDDNRDYFEPPIEDGEGLGY